MADQLQLRGGTTSAIALFTGAQREVVVDTDKHTIVVQDGITAGGYPLASERSVVNGTFYFNDDTGAGSTANAYILSAKSNTQVPTAYTDGIQLGFVTANANTGAATATFSGLGVRALKYRGGIDPAPGDIFGRVDLVYDAGSDWFEIQRQAKSPISQVRVIGASVAGNAMIATMAATTIDFRAPTLDSGTVNSRTTTTPLSITIPSGATLGTANGVAAKIALIAIDNAGTVELAVINTAGAISLDETTLINTSSITGGATANNVFYSATARTGVPYRVVGFINTTQATAGTWSSSPSQVQGQGGQNLIGLRTLTVAPVQATTSGTAIDFTGIPSGVKRIIVSMVNVSTNGTSVVLLQLGTAGGVQTTGYVCQGTSLSGGSVTTVTYSLGFSTPAGNAGNNLCGSFILTLADPANATWVANGQLSSVNLSSAFISSGAKTLSAEITRVRLTTANGTDVFDAGSVNIMYE